MQAQHLEFQWIAIVITTPALSKFTAQLMAWRVFGMKNIFR
jgi:hypothetical protein